MLAVRSRPLQPADDGFEIIGVSAADPVPLQPAHAGALNVPIPAFDMLQTTSLLRVLDCAISTQKHPPQASLAGKA
jgi:hypothetical protein